MNIKIKFIKLRFSHHQDQTCHHKGSGLKVTPFELIIGDTNEGLRQEVQLRMSVYIACFLEISLFHGSARNNTQYQLLLQKLSTL